VLRGFASRFGGHGLGTEMPSLPYPFRPASLTRTGAGAGALAVQARRMAALMACTIAINTFIGLSSNKFLTGVAQSHAHPKSIVCTS
jgi:hypothetical protein